MVKIEKILDNFKTRNHCENINPEYTAERNLVNILNDDMTCGLLTEYSNEVENMLREREFAKTESGLVLKAVVDNEGLTEIRRVDLKKLKKFLTFSKQFGDAVRFSVNGYNFYGLAFGDMKEMVKVVLGSRDGDIANKNFSSKYKIEYIENLVRALDKEDYIDFLVAKDYPLVAIVNDKVAYVVAPRIEEELS